MAKKYTQWIPDNILTHVYAYYSYGEGHDLLPECKLNSNRCPIKDVNLFR